MWKIARWRDGVSLVAVQGTTPAPNTTEGRLGFLAAMFWWRHRGRQLILLQLILSVFMKTKYLQIIVNSKDYVFKKT